jgi:hypothetical protein
MKAAIAAAYAAAALKNTLKPLAKESAIVPAKESAIVPTVPTLSVGTARLDMVELGTVFETPTGRMTLIERSGLQNKKMYQCEYCKVTANTSTKNLYTRGCYVCAKGHSERGVELQATIIAKRLLPTVPTIKHTEVENTTFPDMLVKRVETNLAVRKRKNRVPMTTPASAVYNWETKELVRLDKLKKKR